MLEVLIGYAATVYVGFLHAFFKLGDRWAGEAFQDL